MQTFPEGMNPYPRVKLSFLDIKDFKLEGELYGCVSIIFDIQFEQLENLIKTELSTSSGVSGVIISKTVQVDLC